MNIKFRTWLVLFAVIFVRQTTMALSPRLCSPRIGDRLVIKQLDGVPMFVDTLNSCPNLTNSQIEKNLIMQIWEPAPDDSTSTLVIAKERIVLNMSGTLGNYSISAMSKPGSNTRYNPPLPYGVCDSLSHDFRFTSSGNIASIGNFKSSGRYSSQLTDNLSIVSIEGDTIKNIECLTNLLNETIDANGGESYVHHSRERRWYGTGYRYPLVAEFNDVILSLEGDTIDSNIVWQIIEPQSMDNLADDPVNDYLRSITQNENHNTNEEYETISGQNKNSAVGDFIINSNGENITVTLHAGIIQSDQIRNLLLCDIHGRVFYYNTYSEPSQSASVPLTGMPPGVYLLNIESDNSSAIYRFKM